MASGILVYMLVLPAYLRFGFGEEGGGREKGRHVPSRGSFIEIGGRSHVVSMQYILVFLMC
jgi:hypothetical protein